MKKSLAIIRESICFILVQDQSVNIAHFIDEVALKAFLSKCIGEARSSMCPQIANISLPLTYLAPLGVLHSIDLKEQLHFYLERPADDSSVLAYGCIASSTFSGKGRFQAVKDFSDSCLKRISHFPNDSADGFYGPHFFNAFTFEDDLNEEENFHPATIFLPRWHVFSNSGKYGLVLNVEVSENSNTDALFDAIEKEYINFLFFNYEEGRQNIADFNEQKEVEVTRDVISVSPFEEAVIGALSEIKNQHYQKIVLAQKLVLKNESGLQGIQFLDRLRERFSACYIFSFSDGNNRSFIGASPEILLQVKNGILMTEAIAGSSSRGKKAIEDARLGSNLLTSDKNLREHNLVKESILRRLNILGIDGEADENPRLLALANVQHLQTKISAPMAQAVHFLDVVSELHPTPAVGGQPREQAVPRINKLESFERGLYAGLIGWFNGQNEGKMIVGIRSAEFDAKAIKIYAGAGIVSGSQVEIEKEEILLKQAAMLSLLD
ncbi:MAG: isochorismate synthase [Opitutae bacterium]|nr:isochorismate synthase [Opitutae bacterium]